MRHNKGESFCFMYDFLLLLCGYLVYSELEGNMIVLKTILCIDVCFLSQCSKNPCQILMGVCLLVLNCDNENEFLY